MVVDSEQRCVGILSLSDILSYIVLRPAGELAGLQVPLGQPGTPAAGELKRLESSGVSGGATTTLTSVDECPDLTRCARAFP